jgi:hypothetical protein
MHALLREDERAVAEDVELPRLAAPDRCVEPLVVQLGRETRGPAVVAASDGAIQDLDAHRRSVHRHAMRQTGLFNDTMRT